MRKVLADPTTGPQKRLQAEDWLAAHDLLGAGLRLAPGLLPSEEPGQAELRRGRITIALRHLESWEAREILAATVHDPEDAVRIALASALGRHGDGMVLDLLPRLARSTQPEEVQRAVLVALRENLGRLPEERVASVLRLLGTGAVAREVPGVWVELARLLPAGQDAARTACEEMAENQSRSAAVRAAAQDALGALDDLTAPTTPQRRGLWGVLTAWLPRLG